MIVRCWFLCMLGFDWIRSLRCFNWTCSAHWDSCRLLIEGFSALEFYFFLKLFLLFHGGFASLKCAKNPLGVISLYRITQSVVSLYRITQSVVSLYRITQSVVSLYRITQSVVSLKRLVLVLQVAVIGHLNNGTFKWTLVQWCLIRC